MANQIAVRVLTTPGDVIVAGAQSHIVAFEYGAAARNSGVQFSLVDDEGPSLDLKGVRRALAAEADHQPHVAAIFVENTNMHAGGIPYDLESLAALRSLTTLPIHMDGARLFNASVATGIAPATYASHVTTVMSCMSKGLCAPIGSLLAGPRDLIEAGRLERKRLGGTMRQVGIIAAASLVALDEQVERLAEDHTKAARLAQALSERFEREITAPTNIVAIDLDDAATYVELLEAQGVLAGTVSPQRLRFVVHADVTDDAITEACRVIRELPTLS